MRTAGSPGQGASGQDTNLPCRSAQCLRLEPETRKSLEFEPSSMEGNIVGAHPLSRPHREAAVTRPPNDHLERRHPMRSLPSAAPGVAGGPSRHDERLLRVKAAAGGCTFPLSAPRQRCGGVSDRSFPRGFAWRQATRTGCPVKGVTRREFDLVAAWSVCPVGPITATDETHRYGRRH